MRSFVEVKYFFYAISDIMRRLSLVALVRSGCWKRAHKQSFVKIPPWVSAGQFRLSIDPSLMTALGRLEKEAHRRIGGTLGTAEQSNAEHPWLNWMDMVIVNINK